MTRGSKRHPFRRFVVLAAVVLVVIGAGAYLWLVGPGPTDFAGADRVALADYHGADPTGAPPELAKADLVTRGQYLAQAADCVACHTAKGGVPFAGGLAFVLPFGTLYSTNITPDKDTGIGNYSDADFLNAVHRGIAPGGKRLYPAMPYASYTGLTDADALAIKAFLFSLAPVSAPANANTLKFPFDQRWAMAGWSLFFNSDRRFEPHSGRNDAWNRGAYLVEAAGHCGECHTPRNLAQALDNRAKFAGTVQAGWYAYNISPDKASGIGAWSDEDLAHYLALGQATLHGTAAGPMGEAVDNSLSHLTPGDIAAMVTYLKTVPAVASPDLPAVKAELASADYREGVPVDANPVGKHIFERACIGCHGWTGKQPGMPFAALPGGRAVNDPSATNVAAVILLGARRQTPHGIAAMPAFGAAYSDADIADLVNYVTQRFGDAPSAVTAANIAAFRANQ
jgi:mono/diheme cytochrome c family protein